MAWTLLTPGRRNHETMKQMLVGSVADNWSDYLSGITNPMGLSI